MRATGGGGGGDLLRDRGPALTEPPLRPREERRAPGSALVAAQAARGELTEGFDVEAVIARAQTGAS